MGLSSCVKQKRETIEKMLGNVKGVEDLLLAVKDERFSGDESNSGVFGEVFKERVNYIDKYGVGYKKRGISGSEMDLSHDNEYDTDLDDKVNAVLQDKLQEITEAIKVYDEIKGSWDKQLEYLTSNKQINPMLEELGYLRGVKGYIQNKLNAFAKDNGLEYFMIDVVNSPYTDMGIRVEASLYSNDLQDVCYYTSIDPQEDTIRYPSYVSVGVPYGVRPDVRRDIDSLMKERKDYFMNRISHYQGLTKEVNNNNEKKQTFKGKVFSPVYKMSNSAIKDEQDDTLRDLLEKSEGIVTTRIELVKYCNVLERFAKHLPKIEAEHELIVNYLGEILKVKCVKKKPFLYET